jgi:protocatechuate 3,4-dioxygenase beta subunit
MTPPLRHLLSRRDLLVKGAAGALGLAGLGLTGPTIFAANTNTPTPGLTEGPYWVEELLNRSNVRIDPTTGIVQPGVPLRLLFNVYQLTGGFIYPLPGAVVDIWHCNSLGVYSDIQSEGTLGEKFLRGLQATNRYGLAGFDSIYPGWYHGRTVHIHFRVRVLNPVTKAVAYNFVSQLFLDDTLSNTIIANYYPYKLRPVRDTVNATDGIFTGGSSDGEVASEAGLRLLLRVAGTPALLTGSFNVVIDLSDAGYNNPTGGFGTGPGGPGGSGGPPPGR